MTNELEKQFYSTFGIEPYDRYYNCKDNLEGECTIENTCWTAINLCEDCNEIKECGLQSPFEKLKAILQKISECEVENEV